jgi:hypothetical protein
VRASVCMHMCVCMCLRVGGHVGGLRAIIRAYLFSDNESLIGASQALQIRNVRAAYLASIAAPI